MNTVSIEMVILILLFWKAEAEKLECYECISNDTYPTGCNKPHTNFDSEDEMCFSFTTPNSIQKALVIIDDWLETCREENNQAKNDCYMCHTNLCNKGNKSPRPGVKKCHSCKDKCKDPLEEVTCEWADILATSCYSTIEMKDQVVVKETRGCAMTRKEHEDCKHGDDKICTECLSDLCNTGKSQISETIAKSTTISTTESTTVSTTISTTESTTISTTESTTKYTTESITESNIKSTIEPITESTTKSTIESSTESTTEPTTVKLATRKRRIKNYTTEEGFITEETTENYIDDLEEFPDEVDEVEVERSPASKRSSFTPVFVIVYFWLCI